MTSPDQEVLDAKREAQAKRKANMGTSEYQSTTHGYEEVETRPELIALQCHCGQVIKHRRDSFLPGMHVTTCLACGNISTEVKLIDGETVAVTAESHRDGADG